MSVLRNLEEQDGIYRKDQVRLITHRSRSLLLVRVSCSTSSEPSGCRHRTNSNLCEKSSVSSTTNHSEIERTEIQVEYTTTLCSSIYRSSKPLFSRIIFTRGLSSWSRSWRDSTRWHIGSDGRVPKVLSNDHWSATESLKVVKLPTYLESLKNWNDPRRQRVVRCVTS